MRVIFFTKFGDSSATYRTRLAQYLPFLKAQGIECVVSNLEDGSLERLRWLKRLNEFDLAVVYLELFPNLPGNLESRFLTIPYVYDFDDAIYLIETPFTRGKTAGLIAGAEVVIAGSGELETYAKLRNRNVRLIPTVVDIERYEHAKRPPRPTNAPFTIGWIGTPQTTEYIREIAEPLRKLSATRGARFVTVGASPIELPGVKLEQRQWSDATELLDMASFDVGVMPLKDDEWSRGKCGFKLVQYHALGIPSVASAVGANRSIVEDGVTGLLAQTNEQWIEALTRLADDPELRERLGTKASERARARYCVQRTEPSFLQALLDAAGKTRTGSRRILKRS